MQFLDYRILPYNPLQKVKLPLVENENDSLKYLSIEELKKLLKYLKENPHQKNTKIPINIIHCFI
ncbi:hypothetical protein BC1_00029 [Bacillus phage BC-1]|nr:hypothetical protein BC1_00029 [Bacillus phage BC-1]